MKLTALATPTPRLVFLKLDKLQKHPHLMVARPFCAVKSKRSLYQGRLPVRNAKHDPAAWADFLNPFYIV